MQVYVSKANIDDDLVNSIVDPAQDPNAPDVFFRVISSEGASINSLLQKVKVHLLGPPLDAESFPSKNNDCEIVYRPFDSFGELEGRLN